ncbi:MAG: phosphoglucomutase/phosphomannomutase family protein [Candidatus Aegiribacteria sp.]|nr:phosphoglucomutase/phosphomannomutase family protein [Candidatus Aegiribacteria sp.]
MKIKFGTSGWRGIIAREFTWERVNRVVDAIGLLLHREGRNSIVIGGDCRFLSPELSESTADRMAGYGFEVLLSRGPCPTPVLSHACRKGGHGGVINFTASHNPPLYNGIKFSPWHGGPAGSDLTALLEKMIEEGGKPERDSGRVVKADLRTDYSKDIQKYLNADVFMNSDLKVVYDAFSGAGSGLLDRILVDLGASIRVINGTRDPLFAGRQHPEPGESGTADLALAVVSSGASLGVATDGDADRFGIIDENGEFVSPHDFLPLLLNYLIEVKGFTGTAVRSITTSSLIDRIARDHGFETIVTPVGFKYLGAEMLCGNVILAGEESGGLSIMDHIPEKDGILACLLAAEMVCAGGKGLAAQLDDLQKKYGRIYTSREDLPLDDSLGEHIRENYFKSDPSEIAGLAVHSIDRTDGVQMILEGGDWVLIRLSGTEPLARIYAQSDSSEKRDSILDKVIEEFRHIKNTL